MTTYTTKHSFQINRAMFWYGTTHCDLLLGELRWEPEPASIPTVKYNTTYQRTVMKVNNDRVGCNIHVHAHEKYSLHVIDVIML